ncbi:hypothetical protein MMC18_005362 [Xylographa bjoerkii]|nr:hypothetical protein [Xylographa bjoerkii]
MGRIKKAAGPKHEATLSPALSLFVSTAARLPLVRLPSHLHSFPARWPFPRGDLYHWIPLLDRFDNILEDFVTEYRLNEGPQLRRFGRRLLEKDTSVANESIGNDYVQNFGSEGDREVVETILAFSRTLMENCGNRSLYSSSDRLGEMLNTTSLSLLSTTLRLMARLAQRYHASRQRGANASQHLNTALLASHYNINLHNVQKLADTFVKTGPPILPGSSSTPATTPGIKGKDKAFPDVEAQRKPKILVSGSDMFAVVKDEFSLGNVPETNGYKAQDGGYANYDEWGDVWFSYYRSSSPAEQDSKQLSTANESSDSSVLPESPTPIRQTSGVSRPSRLSTSEDSSNLSATSTVAKSSETTMAGLRTILIPYSTIASTPLEEILETKLSELPKDSHYDFLSRIRVAKALTQSLHSRRQILSIRILAITNLAYIYPEGLFQQKILQHDSDEPRRLQLAYQLAELIHPPGNGKAGIPLELKTIALGALEALSKHKHRAADVCTALSVNVNHGVLLYVLRKTVADLAIEDTNDDSTEDDDWRDALFSLLDSLPASATRTAESLVGAGLFDILTEALTLRTRKAERTHPKILMFMNTIVYSVRDALMTFASSKGLDIVADLISWEVTTSLQLVSNSQGLPAGFKNQVMDYDMPYFQQQTLRWLFKFVNHMMQHGNANFDRLLRNLIDSPQLLSGLRQVLANATVFGSNVWSGAVNILSSFIHNEPTSYAVIAEAGLSKNFLQAITVRDIEDSISGDANWYPEAELGDGGDTLDTIIVPRASEDLLQTHQRISIVRAQEAVSTLARGILPATDAIVTIPQAFGAICLNTAGLDLFLKSGALESFFEVFESPDHVKSMSAEIDLPRLLGGSFDELVRHHPKLKSAVMLSVVVMLARVVRLCRSRAWQNGIGAKLWIVSDDGRASVSGGKQALLGDIADMVPSNSMREINEDITMAETRSEESEEDRAISGLPSSLGNGSRTYENLGPCVSTYINVAAKFLAGFFENNSLCTLFVEYGGVESILNMATVPSLSYDFNNKQAKEEIARVIHMLVEQKPHLVLPSIIHRTLQNLEVVQPLIDHNRSPAFFSQFTKHGSKANGKLREHDEQPSNTVNGTAIIKALLNIHTLCNIFCEAFAQPIFTTRATHTLFSQTNLADMYIVLVKSLGRLHGVCVWEEILLQNSIPDALKEATRIKGYGMGSDEADEVFGFIRRDSSGFRTHTGRLGGTGSMPSSSHPTSAFDNSRNDELRVTSSEIEDTVQLKNVQSIRYLLSQIPSSITPFFQGLGKALIPKRRLESYLRQSAYMVAEALAEATLGQLQYELPKHTPHAKDRYAYWIVILTSISQLMIEGPAERPHPQCLTMVLQAFKNKGGLVAIRDLLEIFFEEVKQISAAPEQLEQNSDGAGRLASAYGGIKIILTFYTHIVTSKDIIDSSQTQGMSSIDRDREHPNYFSPNQFLVELRMAVLPVVRSVWDSDFADRASSSILKCMIEILRTVLDGENEIGAFKRSDKIPVHTRAQVKPFPVSREKFEILKAKHIEPGLAREALYRCVNNREAAEEYCKARVNFRQALRAPIPSYDQEKEKSPSPAGNSQRQDSEATVPDAENTSSDYPMSLPSTASPERESSTAPDMNPQVEIEDTNGFTTTTRAPPPPAPESPPLIDVDGGEGMAMSIDNLLSITDLLNPTPANGIGVGATQLASSSASVNLVESSKAPDTDTVDDLDEERSVVRNNLIDRALDVLNVHADVTFELADLITTAASKAQEASTMRKEIGETLIQSLISFQAEDDLRLAGKKIASYANLLAIVLQEPEFYDASLDELRTNFGQLLGFIKVFPEQTSAESSPWVAQILLVIEKLLAEDVQPQQIKWTPPGNDEAHSDDPIVDMEEPLVSYDEKLQLFHKVVEILPHIGKDESLALSITRVLVILTRNRKISNLLSEKQNLQRLFVMMKQLAGYESEKLQSSFMLVLRHIIEDDETIRQIMCSEITASFQTRTARPMDTTSYVRHMYHLVLRSPTIFVEVTNEKLKLAKFDPNQRPQILTLKAGPLKELPSSNREPSLSEVLELLEGVSGTSKDDIKQSTEGQPSRGIAETEKPKTSDVKPPVVEHPDGVIHYLLTQLLSYKDVEDKQPESSLKEVTQEASSAPSSDVEMVNGSSQSPSPSMAPNVADNESEKKGEKPEFKPDQHPIHIYRCFLLQCLSELLSCYNRAKVEFINFSRKADPKAMTPSKPRSGVLSYLLNVLLPEGTLLQDQSNAFLKKTMTSKAAISTIVALCIRTGENGHEKTVQTFETDSEPELLFVRKFVLEHALKAYKDAHASNEALDFKYSRLQSLADLFNNILVSRSAQIVISRTSENDLPSHKELAKIMFEKNFIAALTASIADIDLNFPGSKNAIKYILEPLKILTETAIYLSETSSITTAPGYTDDDQISTASSVSDLDDGREETPDLFRHSTLGMLEPGRDEESSSESSDEDEDMYDDEYDDGMEYEEEMERDGDEVVSDEDEEIDGAGHVEGLPGDVGMDVEVVIGEDDDDEDDASEDDDPDDSEDMDEEEEIEIIDEITGDGNESMVEDNDEEWQDEDEDREEFQDEDGLIRGTGDPHDHDQHNHGATVRDLMREMQNVGGPLPGLDGREFAVLDEFERSVYLEEPARDEDDDDEDDEDEMDDEDVIYEPDYEDDEVGMPDPPWGWDPDDELAVPTRGHTHHHNPHPRRMPNPWTFPSGERGMIGEMLELAYQSFSNLHLVPAYQSHRGSRAPRGTDDGTNPLLQRLGHFGPTGNHPRANRLGPSDPAATMSDWVHAIHPRHQSEGAVSFINSIVSAVNSGGPGFGAVGGPHGALHFHIGGNGPLAALPREIQAVLGLRRPMHEPTRSTREDSLNTTAPIPITTVVRWQEEARLLFGNSYTEKIQRVVNSLLKILVPPVIEEERIRKQQEAEAAERLKKQKEEADKAAEEARLLKEAAEKEVKEQLEREAAERAVAEDQAARNDDATHTDEMSEPRDTDPMEGVESARLDAAATDSEARPQPDISAVVEDSEQVARVRATFRGREVDITELHIDLEYLNALPDDLREEVLMQQLAEQRSQAAASGEEPTDISREFLEALPPEIREELLQQEAQDRRRREREENRRRAPASGSAQAGRGDDMDPASFLASLDPHLRQAVLLEQDEDVLAQLPQHIAEEARALGGERTMRRWEDVPRINRVTGRIDERLAPRENRPENGMKKPPRRQVVQMLDKAGVATLLRLLFVHQGSSRQVLNEILHNVSQNRQNRAEVISLLLSILQDGSSDVGAVERSFVHLSLKAKQPSSQKTPQPLKRILNVPITTPINSDMTPLMVIQQCLNALVHLTEMNPHIPSFFLTEHETSSGLRSKASKKGKGKETRASKFALNALLSLLDRKLIMESSGCMEQLSTLLQSITQPLNFLLRKEKEKATKPSKEGEDLTALGNQVTSNVEEAVIPPETTVQSEDTQMAEPGPITPETHSEVPTTLDTSRPTRDLVDEIAGSADNKDEDQKPETEASLNKQRTLSPPVVPEYNLRLVVNILAARECSAKTFRDTLSTINNLSAIPGAKEIFGNELIRQAQDLGEAISRDLDDLIPQIQSAETGTDIQGMALSKFSPSSSDQAKLLRVLTALDYLFDPKRNGGKSTPSAELVSADGESKDDLLTTLYENSTFGPLWVKLSDCLSTIRQRENMANVATILLPLVEALMVVCKNTTLKDATSMKITKEFAVTSPPPESRMENLFFRFTEDHRKILNDLVRHNPRLMSGTFSLLVKNPKVLEFDNKRNYFTRRLHSRSAEARHPQPPLQLGVRRDQVFLDSFKSLYYKSGDEMKYGKLSIRFHGEEGVDAGGVTREWFQVMSRQMFNADYALFIPVASDRTTFHPNKSSFINPEHLMFFKFIGRVIGKALYEGRALDCHFSRAVYKRILGKPVSIKDMETLDLDYYKSLLWMLENDIADIITETFSVETEEFGVTEIVDLIENGRNIPVTEENKQEFVQLVVEYRLTGSVKLQLEEFLKGFHDIVPAELISIFNEQELELLISGLPDIDVDDWKNNTEYHNYQASSPQIQWFWRAVRSFDKEERAKLLQFVTGTSKVPLNGFKELEGMNGFSRFNIHRDYGNKDRLPSSHTCFNQLDLPEYESYEALRQQVYTAMTAGSDYFGFA